MWCFHGKGKVYAWESDGAHLMHCLEKTSILQERAIRSSPIPNSQLWRICLKGKCFGLSVVLGLGVLLSLSLWSALGTLRQLCFLKAKEKRSSGLLLEFAKRLEVPGRFSIWKREFGGLRLPLSPQVSVHKSKPGVPSCFSLEVDLALFFFCLGSLPLRCFKSKIRKTQNKTKPDSRENEPTLWVQFYKGKRHSSEVHRMV